MNIKDRLLILEFLKLLKCYLDKDETRKGIPFITLNYLSTDFMRKALKYKDGDTYDEDTLSEMTDLTLCQKLESEQHLINYIIHQWTEHIDVLPKRANDASARFFKSIEKPDHYLCEKPTEAWDEYDISHYHSLLFRLGVSKKAYIIYVTGNQPDEEYAVAVTTKESYFFDNQQQVENEIEKIIQEGKYTREDLNVKVVYKFMNPELYNP